MPYEIVANHAENNVTCKDTLNNTELVLPRFIPWAEIDLLPHDILCTLNRLCNILEYSDSSYLSKIKLTLDSVNKWIGKTALANGVSKNEKILDFGTGTGLTRLGLLNDGFANTYGVDVSEDCLTRQSQSSVELGLSSIEDENSKLMTTEELYKSLPEMAGTFSMIITSSVLHHIADLPSLLLTFRTLLREGGRLVAFSEPINKLKWHALSANPNPVVDLFDFVGLEGTIPSRKTRSTTYLAEVWDGRGFHKNDFDAMLKNAGFRLLKWEPGMWITYLCHHMVRHYLSRPGDMEQRKEFAELYEEAQKLENRFKRILKPDFISENFFTVSIVAEAC